MGWFEALVLGLVQGLTEFLPISSSAHLRITAALAGWDDPGAAFTAVTQIGTELALICYFAKDIGNIVRAWFYSLYKPEYRHNSDARLGWLIIIGTIPIVVLGLLLEDSINHSFRDLRITATVLIVFGLLLWLAERVGRHERGIEHLTLKHGFVYGLAQAMALVPGVSRSGGTTTAGLMLGYTRAAATRYGFLLAIPAVLGSGVYKLGDIGGGSSPSWGPTIFATLVSFGVGYAVTAWLMGYVKRHSYLPFIIYRIALGVLIFILVAVGVVPAAAGPIG
jgi:undecaprenyl-diphosphatase